jgi:Ca2+-binding RTX toxin-like protein
MTTISATWNTTSGLWFSPGNWDEPNPNPPPPLLHYVPGPQNDVIIPDHSGMLTPFTITYDGISTINTLTSTRAVTLDFVAGSLTIDNGGGTGVFLENGLFEVAPGFVLTNNAGTLSFNGGTLAGTLAGSGIFRFINGTFDLEAGLSITVANWLLTYQIGSGTVSTTNLNADLTYAGTFTIDAPFGNPAILNLNSHTLTLTGTSTIGGNIVGPGTLRILGDATFTGTSHTGGVLLQVAQSGGEAGAATQTGSYDLLGTLQVDAGASYTITAVSNISSFGTANEALVLNNGTFADTAASATASRLDVAFTNAVGATLSVAAGATLRIGFSDFRGTTESLYNGALIGDGTLWLAGNSALNATTLTVGAILADNTTTIARNLTYAGQFTLASFARLELGNRTLVLSGTSDFATGFNTIDGAGTLRITGSSSFGGVSVGTGEAATLRNSGAVTQTAGITLHNGSTLLNDAGRTYTLAGGDITLLGNSLVTNNGTFLVTNANTASHATNGGNFTNAGTLHVAAGATLQLGVSGGSATLGGTVTGAGALALAGNVTVNTQIGTASLAANGTTTLGVDLDYAGAFFFGGFARINLAGHTLTLAGTAALTGGFNQVDGAGTLKVTGSATFAGFSAGVATGVTLQNAGAVTQTGNITLNNGSALLNDAGRIYTLAGGDITLLGGSLVTNNGTFLVTNANTASHAISGGSFTNAGTLEVAAGATLQLGVSGGSATLGGTVTGAGGLVLAGNVTVNTQIGTASLAANGTTTLGQDLDYAGIFSFGGFARINLGSHTLTLSGTASLTGGFNIIDGAGTLKVTGSATFNGFSTGATQAVTIRNAGTVTQTGTITLNNGSMLINEAGGAYSVTGGAINAGAVTNAGTFIGNAAGSHAIGTSFLNQGLIVVEQGSFVFNQLTSLGVIQGVIAVNGTQTTVTPDAPGQLTLTGGSADNRIVVTAAPTLADGGAGTDTLVIAASMSLLPGSLVSIERIEVANGVAADLGALGGSLPVTLASLAGGGSTVAGTIGADSIRGGAGDDEIDGGAGADTLAGGAGNDLYRVDVAGDRVAEAAGAGADTVLASMDASLANNVEALVLLAGALHGTGNNQANLLVGNDGANTLYGLGGADTMQGGLGDDTYRADALDMLVEQPGGGFDRVIAINSFTLENQPEIEALLLTGANPANGTGNALGNLIIGNGQANRLDGLGGADTLNGGAGNDTLRGGEGADSLFGGGGLDRLEGGPGDDLYRVTEAGVTVVEGANAGTDLVFSTVSFTLGNHVENLTLIGGATADGIGNTAANILLGNNAANLLDGGSGHDSLSGAGGNDTLVGGAGADTLAGGNGFDVFRYALPTHGTDRVNDYLVAQDTIEISAAGFGGGLVAGMAIDEPDRFVANTTGLATSAAGTGQFIYETDTLTLWFDADGMGGAVARALLTFASAPANFNGNEIVVIA